MCIQNPSLHLIIETNNCNSGKISNTMRVKLKQNNEKIYVLFNQSHEVKRYSIFHSNPLIHFIILLKFQMQIHGSMYISSYSHT